MEKPEYRAALGACTTGVIIVTTFDDVGDPWSVTANSTTSASLDSPVIMVGLDKQGRARPALTASSQFVVNNLSAGRQRLAAHVASSTENRFTGVEHERHGEGAPVLPYSAAWLDRRAKRWIDKGDHTIMMDEALAFDQRAHAALCYYRGSSATLPQAEPSLKEVSHV